MIAGIAVVTVIGYLLVSQSSSPATQTTTGTPPTAQPAPPRDRGGEPGLPGIFDFDAQEQENAPWPVVGATITLKLALGALLATLLAFRPRRDSPILSAIRTSPRLKSFLR
jgi:hypothetical protein